MAYIDMVCFIARRFEELPSMTISRRSWLWQTCSTLGVFATAGSLSLGGIDPLPRRGPFSARLSLAAYSYRDFLTGKKTPKMTLFDVANLAAEMGLAAIEPTSYYFTSTTLADLAKLKQHCARQGLDISGGAIANDFCRRDPEKRAADLQHVRNWIERYAFLGAKTIRIFAGSVEKGDTEEAARQRCVDAIHEACDHAAKFGILLALENHGGITATADQLLAIVKLVKHDAFGVNLDTGNFHSEDPYADVARLAPYAVTVQFKTEIKRGRQPKEPVDVARMIEGLKLSQYQGYIALEHEAAEDPFKHIPLHVQALKQCLGMTS